MGCGRRNTMVPVPEFDSFAALNTYLEACCVGDLVSPDHFDVRRYAFHASELRGGFVHPCRAPTQCHLSVAPPFHVGAVVAAALDH